MNAARPILLILYFLTMVLLPYGHMPLHAADHAESEEIHSGCQHSHHEPDSESDADHDCSICNLTVLLSEIPSVFTFFDLCFTLHLPATADYGYVDAILCLDHKARAPPFITV